MVYGQMPHHLILICLDILSNLSTKEKFAIHHSVGSTAGAGRTKSRMEGVGKWANTVIQ
jgi:hypothetical protein